MIILPRFTHTELELFCDEMTYAIDVCGGMFAVAYRLNGIKAEDTAGDGNSSAETAYRARMGFELSFVGAAVKRVLAQPEKYASMQEFRLAEAALDKLALLQENAGLKVGCKGGIAARQCELKTGAEALFYALDDMMDLSETGKQMAADIISGFAHIDDMAPLEYLLNMKVRGLGRTMDGRYVLTVAPSFKPNIFLSQFGFKAETIALEADAQGNVRILLPANIHSDDKGHLAGGRIAEARMLNYLVHGLPDPSPGQKSLARNTLKGYPGALMTIHALEEIGRRYDQQPVRMDKRTHASSGRLVLGEHPTVN